MGTKIATTDKVVIGAKGAKYNPKSSSMQDNAATWATVQGALAKGAQTFGSLQKLCKETHNHGNFVGYAIRRKWLAVK